MGASSQGFYSKAYSSNQKYTLTPKNESRELNNTQQIPMFGNQMANQNKANIYEANKKGYNSHDVSSKNKPSGSETGGLN